MALDDWQQLLRQRFTELRRTRSAVLGARPVFALEHGLSAPELQALEVDARTHIISFAPSDDHYLAWVVYATEFGYRYSGEEYWQTFEHETPGWGGNEARYWLRRCFRQFAREFGGAEPSGRWAEHFSIICWPITHAVLPRDLQRHLARALYGLRHALVAEVVASPPELGQRIAARSWQASSRFQEFAEHYALVGTVASALLRQGLAEAQHLLLPAALERIRSDLDRERRARDWLRSAKTAAQQLRLRGLRSGRPPGPPTPVDSPAKARAAADGLALAANLALRPHGDGSWQAVIDLPDLSPVAVRFPYLREILANSRCVVSGSDGRPLARGRLLSGQRTVILHEWPQPGEVLVKYEETSPELEYLLACDCMLRPGPTWLFRIAPDGCAKEVRNLAVRPECSYVLVSAATPPLESSIARAARLDCRGVSAVRLEVPSAVSQEYTQALQRLGLTECRTVEVWPVGLPAARWDHEGQAEWLASDSPFIGFRTDHPVRNVTLSLDGEPTQACDVGDLAAGDTVFIELPRLQVGRHVMRVLADAEGAESDRDEGQLDILVRETCGWSPGLYDQGVFTVMVDPSRPSLEQLWQGEVSVHVYGPASRQLKCTLSLFETGNDKPSRAETIGGLRLPMRPPDWASLFRRRFSDKPEVQRAYDRAESCRVRLSCAELGWYRFVCQREFTALRWVVRPRRSSYALVLVDDTGLETEPTVEHYGFRHPDEPVPVAGHSAAEGFTVPEQGGLYLARSGPHSRAAILPPAVLPGFGSMRVVPELKVPKRTPQAVIAIAGLLDVWVGARRVGRLLARLRQQDVVASLVRNACVLVCGDRWAEVEDLLSGPGDRDVLPSVRRIYSDKREEVGIWEAFYADKAALADPLSDRLARLRTGLQTGLGGLHCSGLHAEESVLRFAMKLASGGAGLLACLAEPREGQIAALLEAPAIVRAARFLVLVSRTGEATPDGTQTSGERQWG